MRGRGLSLRQVLYRERKVNPYVSSVPVLREGLDGQDRQTFGQHEIVPVHMAPHILSTETPAIATMGILQYELEDLA